MWLPGGEPHAEMFSWSALMPRHHSPPRPDASRHVAGLTALGIPLLLAACAHDQSSWRTRGSAQATEAPKTPSCGQMATLGATPVGTPTNPTIGMARTAWRSWQLASGTIWIAATTEPTCVSGSRGIRTRDGADEKWRTSLITRISTRRRRRFAAASAALSRGSGPLAQISCISQRGRLWLWLPCSVVETP